jgi:DNA-binding response OmpR family regulator
MKILFVHPEINAQHKTCTTLAERGVVILFARNGDEAWKLIQFHGVSLDLAVIHREGWTSGASSEEGAKLIDRIKADSLQADLPIVMTSWRWGSAEFAKHQQGKSGVNAYLKWPTPPEDLLRTIDIVLGNEAGGISTQEQAPVSTPEPPSAPELTLSSAPSLALETSSQVLPVQELGSASIQLEPAKDELGSTGTINLDAPELVASQSMPSAPSMGTDAGTGLEISPSGMSDGISLEAHVIQLEPAQEGGLELSIASPSDGELEPHERLGFSPDGTSNQPSATQILEANLLSESSNDVEEAPAMPLPSDATTVEPVLNLGAGSELSFVSEMGGTTLDQQEPAVFTPEEAPQPQQEEELPVEEIEGEMPYLFKSRNEQAAKESPAMANPMLAFTEPVGDAVVPGGAANSPDTETLKKYLMLREQDVAVLSNQLAAAREQVATLEKTLREERAKGADLNHSVGEQQRKLDEFESGKRAEFSALQAEIEELRFQAKAKTDKVRVLEIQVREASGEIEKMKERVRNDIRKIRVREKELENRLEIVKKDSEALLAARENKMIELKRKLDLLEFNMDLLQDQYTREKDTSALLRERLSKAAQVVRVAGGLLGPSVGSSGISGSSSVDDSAQDPAAVSGMPSVEELTASKKVS